MPSVAQSDTCMKFDNNSKVKRNIFQHQLFEVKTGRGVLAEAWPLLLSGAPPAFWAGKIDKFNPLKLIWHTHTFFQITTQPDLNHCACCPLSVCARDTQPCRWYTILVLLLELKLNAIFFSQSWGIISFLGSWYNLLLILFPGPTEKMTLLQSVTDALDIALTKVLLGNPVKIK